MSEFLLSFFGDDFTGSTDAMESLARAGVKTVLFTTPPTPQRLARYPGLRAFGVAGTTRAMPSDEMERALAPALMQMRDIGAPIVHYKVCSTFDSSPNIGSIGRAIDVGARIFDHPPIPVIPAAPALGRYCVFGNLFARCGGESEPFRIDRHPSMSRHPTTPMNESDLRLHLRRQTTKSIGLIDVLALERAKLNLGERREDIMLVDLLYERHLPIIGSMLDHRASRRKPLFVVGSSGVESALTAHWTAGPAAFQPIRPCHPILAVCGSRSPVTARQIESALAAGFASVPIDAHDALGNAVDSLRRGSSTLLHAPQLIDPKIVGDTLGRLAREVMGKVSVGRAIIAGGDTAGKVAHALGIESMEMIGELVRGSPLVRVTAPGSPADGIEMTFKGGQIGPADFFTMVEKGTLHA